MKPSRRIAEISKKITSDEWVNNNSVSSRFRSAEDYLDYLLDSPFFVLKLISNYLDEEWEKNKPCKHESSYKVEGLSDLFYNVCNDCGVLFSAPYDAKE